MAVNGGDPVPEMVDTDCPENPVPAMVEVDWPPKNDDVPVFAKEVFVVPNSPEPPGDTCPNCPEDCPDGINEFLEGSIFLRRSLCNSK